MVWRDARYEKPRRTECAVVDPGGDKVHLRGRLVRVRVDAVRAEARLEAETTRCERVTAATILAHDETEDLGASVAVEVLSGTQRLLSGANTGNVKGTYGWAERVSRDIPTTLEDRKVCERDTRCLRPCSQDREDRRVKVVLGNTAHDDEGVCVILVRNIAGHGVVSTSCSLSLIHSTYFPCQATTSKGVWSCVHV